jgi:Antirestriction protein
MQAVSIMKIEAYPVPEHARVEVLPRYFGWHMLTVERRVYNLTSQFARAYSGGYWHFFELSNRGFYMSPPDVAYEICIDGNGFRGRMSGDAAGIAVCLFTFSQLSFEHTTDIFTEHFHRLRDFASEHAEAHVIFQAID